MTLSTRLFRDPLAGAGGALPPTLTDISTNEDEFNGSWSGNHNPDEAKPKSTEPDLAAEEARKAAEEAAAIRNAVVIAGVEAHVCLLQTALELLEEEFEVWVVTDACGSRTERNRDAAYDRLAGNGAELVTTEMVAFEWLRSAEHPLFREMQALIK